MNYERVKLYIQAGCVAALLMLAPFFAHSQAVEIFSPVAPQVELESLTREIGGTILKI